MECVFDGPAAITAARQRQPDVVVLDLGLPGLDGIEVCRQLRTFTDCYVVMLTARADEVDKLVGLRVGADDYLTKPFSPREVVARVRAMLRRPRTGADTGEQEDPPRRFGPLQLDVTARELHLDGRAVELTRTEFDVHIGHLRRKLSDDPAAPRFIRTVRGVGYRMGQG